MWRKPRAFIFIEGSDHIFRPKEEDLNISFSREIIEKLCDPPLEDRRVIVIKVDPVDYTG